MNTGLQSLMTNWFRPGDHDMPDDMPPPPPIAMLPMPEQTEEEKRLKTIADAHIFVAQLAQERAVKDQQIEHLQSEVGNLTHALVSERRKSGLLELDVAERDNTIASLQSELLEKNDFLNTVKDINDKTAEAFTRLDIKGTAKKERKPRPKKKADRESADPTAKADG